MTYEVTRPRAMAKAGKTRPINQWRPALVVAGTYVIFGLFWITLSDRVVAALVSDVNALRFLQTIKGFFYVLITGLLVFVLSGTVSFRFWPAIRSPMKSAGSTGGRESILVVDDSEDQRELASDLLASFGYNVRTVTNGREAISELKYRLADLVVLDMILEPSFDGLDTFRAIRTLRPDQKNA